MSRQASQEKETLRISAEMAERLILKLRDDIKQAKARMKALQLVVNAHAQLSGRRPKVLLEADAPRKRAPKGQVLKHVEEILHVRGGLEEPELRKAIHDKFGIAYGRATVYTTLRRGAADHKFMKEGKKWSLNPMRITASAT